MDTSDARGGNQGTESGIQKRDPARAAADGLSRTTGVEFEFDSDPVMFPSC